MCQRAIPPRVIDVLLRVGRRDHDHRGGVRVHLFDKKRRERFAAQLRTEYADKAAWRRYANVYVVLDAPRSQTSTPYVITVARRDHRTRFK